MLKVERTAFDYRDKTPAAWFLKVLSKQVTPQIKKLIVEDTLRDHLSDLICLTLDPESYMELHSEKSAMRMILSSRSAAFNICNIDISWSVEMGCCPFPWDTCVNKSIRFDTLVHDSEIRNLNAVLPMLYHPLVKSSQSGLPFDYQIFYGGETFHILFEQPISDDIQDAVARNISLFVDQWNASKSEPICLIDIRRTGAKTVQTQFDFGSNAETAIKWMIFRFECVNGIRKVICR